MRYVRIHFGQISYVVESPPNVDSRNWKGHYCERAMGWGNESEWYEFIDSPRPWPGYVATYRWVRLNRAPSPRA